MKLNETGFKGVSITFFVFLVVVIALTECKTKEAINKKVPAVDFITESKRLRHLIEEDVTQKFTFEAIKPIVVKGRQGTVITIDPKNLETESGGDLTGKEIIVELKELVNQYDLARSDAQTISDGQVLISGGAYWLNVTTEGTNLRIREGKSIKVEFPRLSDEEMSLFYGQRDSLNQMNWLRTDIKFSGGDDPSAISDLSEVEVDELSLENSDTIYDDEKTRKTKRKISQEVIKNRNASAKLYQAIELKQLGWINVDRFYELTDSRDLRFAFNPRDSVTSAMVYLIFEDINSVLTTTYFKVNDTILNNVFYRIPGNGAVKLVGVTIRNEEVFAFQELFNLESDSQIEFRLEKTSEERLADLFN